MKSLNTKGFSLISVLVAIGVTSTLMLAFMSVSTDQFRANATLRMASAAETQNTLLKMALRDTDTCKANFAGTKLASTTAQSKKALGDLYFVNPSTKQINNKDPILKVGGEVQGVKVKGAQLVEVKEIGNNRYIGQIDVRYESIGGNLGAQEIQRRVPISLVTNLSKDVVECSTDGSETNPNSGESPDGSCGSKSEMTMVQNSLGDCGGYYWEMKKAKGGNGQLVRIDTEGFPTQNISLTTATHKAWYKPYNSWQTNSEGFDYNGEWVASDKSPGPGFTQRDFSDSPFGKFPTLSCQDGAWHATTGVQGQTQCGE